MKESRQEFASKELKILIDELFGIVDLILNGKRKQCFLIFFETHLEHNLRI